MKVSISKHDGDANWEEVFTIEDDEDGKRCIIIEKNGHSFEIGEQDDGLFIIQDRGTKNERFESFMSYGFERARMRWSIAIDQAKKDSSDRRNK